MSLPGGSPRIPELSASGGQIRSKRRRQRNTSPANSVPLPEVSHWRKPSGRSHKMQSLSNASSQRFMSTRSGESFQPVPSISSASQQSRNCGADRRACSAATPPPAEPARSSVVLPPVRVNSRRPDSGPAPRKAETRNGRRTSATRIPAPGDYRWSIAPQGDLHSADYPCGCCSEFLLLFASPG